MFLTYQRLWGPFNPKRLKEAIKPGVDSEVLKSIAVEQGFETMSLDGINKALKGLTTIDEIFRVAPPDFDDMIQKTVIKPAELETPEYEFREEISLPISSGKSTRILVADDNESKNHGSRS